MDRQIKQRFMELWDKYFHGAESGCASIVDYPYHESRSEHPRAGLGLFDVSARSCVPAEVLTFAIPWVKFVSMVDNMEESFLITKSWDAVHARIERRG